MESSFTNGCPVLTISLPCFLRPELCKKKHRITERVEDRGNREKLPQECCRLLNRHYLQFSTLTRVLLTFLALSAIAVRRNRSQYSAVSASSARAIHAPKSTIIKFSSRYGVLSLDHVQHAFKHVTPGASDTALAFSQPFFQSLFSLVEARLSPSEYRSVPTGLSRCARARPALQTSPFQCSQVTNMSAEADNVVVEADPAAGVGPEEEEPQEGTAARSSEVTNDRMEGGGGMMEMAVYKSSSSSATQEASVLCVVTDETTTRRFNYSLPFSSAVTDLYTAVAHEAGVILIMQNMVGT